MSYFSKSLIEILQRQGSACPLIIVCLFVSEVWQIQVCEWVRVLEEKEIWGEWSLGTNQLLTVMSLDWSEAAALVKNTIIQSSFVTRAISFEMVYWMMFVVDFFDLSLGIENEVIKRILVWNDTWDQIWCFAVCQWIVLSAKKIIPSFIGTEICSVLLWSSYLIWSDDELRKYWEESRSKYQNVTSVALKSQ